MPIKELNFKKTPKRKKWKNFGVKSFACAGVLSALAWGVDELSERTVIVDSCEVVPNDGSDINAYSYVVSFKLSQGINSAIIAFNSANQAQTLIDNKSGVNTQQLERDYYYLCVRDAPQYAIDTYVPSPKSS